MDARTTTADLLMAQYGRPESLYNMIVRRLRARQMMFGDKIKLVLRQIEDEHWAHLEPPYLLVVPTLTRIRLQPTDQPVEAIINPRSVTFVAQLDARATEAEWAAADDIELAEKQLIDALVNWQPTNHYKPTGYAGMRVEGTRIPQVKVLFVFQFFEEITFCDDPLPRDVECCPMPECLEIAQLVVNPRIDCPPPKPNPCDPCGVDPDDPPSKFDEPPGAHWPALGGWPPPDPNLP